MRSLRGGTAEDAGEPLISDDGDVKVDRLDRLEECLMRYTAERETQQGERLSQAASKEGTGAYPSYVPAPAADIQDGTYSLGETGKYRDVIVRGIIDIRYAGLLLDEFRLMSQNYPYVIISPGTSLEFMRHHNPMLLLAILVSASWIDRELQATLEHIYLSEIGRKMVLEAEESLDLLQGILIHLSWFVAPSTWPGPD